MRLKSDLFPSGAIEAARLAREAAMPFSAFGEQIRAFKLSPAQQAMEEVLRREAMLRASFYRYEMQDGFRAVSEFARMHAEQDQRWRAMFSPAMLEQAHTAAKLAQSFALPAVMEQFRTPIDPLAGKMLGLRSLDLVSQPAYIEAFARTSALSDVLSDSIRVGRELREATHAFARGSIPAFDTLGDYRNFLDAAGLRLPRWPRVRLLSAAEKRRRFRARLKEKAEPPHLKRAKSLVHRYELILRDILDAAMAETYGEDWAETRLPLCECKDLLGRWRKRGGDVLDHADYAHYSRIMSHSEHFDAVFEAGFDDPTALAELLAAAGRLRAASHHARTFTQEDLRDLRMTWTTIETGLLAFTGDYEIET
ncbi:hypothetical protein PUR21_21660 [Methylorubrum rhodesianum]|uniref:Swt1-like HEPN domain-containing protein n=1 Tax=Methylorubrum rhodesianum TaxID=29427 RepID=A0ABU9ZH14_9HYPH